MSVNYTKREDDQLDWVPVADESELPQGERLFVEIDEHRLVIFNISGKFYAIADICSHDGGQIGEGEFEGEYEISCPRHGARFDVRDGKVLSLPAVVDIPAFPVKINGGYIEVGVPSD